MVNRFLSKKFYVSEYVWIDGWTAAHFLLGIIIATTTIGSSLFDFFKIPSGTLFFRFIIFTALFELFEIIVGKLTRYKVFKEPGIDILWDFLANIAGFFVGNQFISMG